MENITLQQLLDADFRISEESPVMSPFDGGFVVADPSLLTPDKCHDKKWHMFFHTTFGVYHAESEDGIDFSKRTKILNRAMRPNINYIDGTYYLFYERTLPLFLNALNVVNLVRWKSEIYVTESKDLTNWSEPYPVIRHTKDFEKSPRGTELSNPFLVREAKKHYL